MARRARSGLALVLESGRRVKEAHFGKPSLQTAMTYLPAGQEQC